MLMNKLIGCLFVLEMAMLHVGAEKFFYGQLYNDGIRSYISLGTGQNSKNPMNLLLNSEELTLALFTTICNNATLGSNCDVPDPYVPVNETETGRQKNTSHELAFLYQKAPSNPGGISRIQLTGMEASGTLNISLSSYLRQFVYNGYVFEVMQLDQPYESDLISGFVGFGPYTAIRNLDPTTSRVQLSENFLYQLKEEGHIDKQIIAFNVDADMEKESMIKLGGYDPECFQDISKIALLNTTSLDSWTVQSEQIRMQLGSPVTMINLPVIVEPAFPFIYVTSQLFTAYKESFTSFMDQKGIKYEVQGDYIMFVEQCDMVSQNFSDSMSFEIVFNDQSETFTFNISELLVNARFIDTKEARGQCYLGIFPNINAKDLNTIYLGQLFLQKYYVYFDASGYQSGTSEHLQVAMGLRNPEATPLKSQYNSSAWNYQSQEGDQSDWTYEPNPYTAKSLDAKDSEHNGKTIIYLIVIAVALVLVITVIICLLERSRKRTERDTIGAKIDEEATAENGDKLLATANDDKINQSVDKSLEDESR